jgi:hypothetical protein
MVANFKARAEVPDDKVNDVQVWNKRGLFVLEEHALFDYQLCTIYDHINAKPSATI